MSRLGCINDLKPSIQFIPIKRNFKAEYKVDNPCACQKDQVVRFTKFPTFIDQGGKH